MCNQQQDITLLIVDDERVNRLLLTELFQDKYKIIQAKNGVQAIKLAQEHLPELILLDVLMPEMDGLEVIKELKRLDSTRQIPVIFITALNSPTDEEQGLNLGAVDYIAKPFHSAIVRVRVENHLRIVHQRNLLESLALLDGLTGIPNRRSFDEAFEREWLRAVRDNKPLSLLILDLDQFKLYNDTLGHAAGDRVLQEVSKVQEASLGRGADFVARYGGEEFAILLPDTPYEGAIQVANLILSNLAEKNIPHPSSTVAEHITFSIGCVSCIPDSNLDKDTIFKQADELLYQAKSQGRNRVVGKDLIKI